MVSHPDQDGNTNRIVQRDYHRPKLVTKTLKHLRRVAKSAEHTLGRNMSTLEGRQYVLLVKALRQNRSGQVHEVVEIVGSPGLKESFEAHLSDVLNDVPADKDATDGNGTQVEEHLASDAAELDVPIVGEDKVLPPTSSFLTLSSVELAQDSQDSILDIKGVTDDEQVSLMEKNAQPLKGSSTLYEAVETTAQEVSGCSLGWRTMDHEDDPFLSLISCEIPRVVACLEKTSFDHLQAYQQLGFHITDA
ncbi:hypothetical protein M9434_002773 [Picochlorum sp. BPE23]|nr:hypothetical protein M9434_002773 [Picochlorum sp. BPE23]